MLESASAFDLLTAIRKCFTLLRTHLAVTLAKSLAAIESENMETTVVLDHIPFQADKAALYERLHVDADSEQAEELGALIDHAQAIARPKGLYRIAYITAKDDVSVEIEGVRFSSRVLRVNLDAVQRVFPYVATCGVELDTWSHTLGDVLHAYWVEAIKLAAVGAAIKALNEHMDNRYRPGHTSAMNPGSLLDWPLREQRPLFKLLGDPRALIGVELTPSMLMVPNKSVSGIRFATEADFASCQLCPREDCPGRRAPYDPALYDRKYRPVSDDETLHS